MASCSAIEGGERDSPQNRLCGRLVIQPIVAVEVGPRSRAKSSTIGDRWISHERGRHGPFEALQAACLVYNIPLATIARFSIPSATYGIALNGPAVKPSCPRKGALRQDVGPGSGVDQKVPPQRPLGNKSRWPQRTL